MEGLITISKDKDSFFGKYKGSEIVITRDKDNNNFYIQVFNDQGYGYDGWWDDSEFSTIDDAIVEAIDGAML